jgi:hypothetical protein
MIGWLDLKSNDNTAPRIPFWQQQQTTTEEVCQLSIDRRPWHYVGLLVVNRRK